MAGSTTLHKGRICYLALETLRPYQGSFTHVTEIASGLKSRGWHLDLLTPEVPDPDHKGPGLMRRSLAWGRLQTRLVFSARTYDVVYIRSHNMSLPASLICWLLRVPVIQEINGTYEDLFVAYPALGFLRPLLVAALRFQYRMSDGLVAVTQGLRDLVQADTGRDDCVVIHNAANHRRFDPSRRGKVPNGARTPYVVFAGGLTKWHGIETLLESVSCTYWPEGVSLVVAGKGSLFNKVSSAAEKSARIIALGKLPHEDIPSLLNHAIACLIPNSNPRGRADKGLSPLKLYEAMACELPVIVSDLKEQSDLVRTTRCGLIIPVDDPKALAKAVAEIAGDENEAAAMGRRGRQAILRGHTWEHRLDDTEKVLVELLEARPKVPLPEPDLDDRNEEFS